MTRNTHAVHIIDDEENFTFSPSEYSRLKFGDDLIAKQFAIDMATTFFAEHAPMLIVNQCVVIASPYNHLRNAASLITKHFIDHLNHLLVNKNGNHVQSSIIHRKVTYTADYGFLSKQDRARLIGNDDFYFNHGFVEDKVLIFIDDVRITGTHEDILVNIMNQHNLSNPRFFLYYAMVDQSRNLSPQVEAKINFSAMDNVQDFVSLANSENYQVIVRSVKYLLGLKDHQLEYALKHITRPTLQEIYYGALGEGYYKNPTYQHNFLKLHNKIVNR